MEYVTYLTASAKRLAALRRADYLEHDPEKWKPVFG
jgi:hypothetical protein